MSQINPSSRPYLRCFKSDGTLLPLDELGQATLVAATTYYFHVATPEQLLEHLHLTWANAIVLTSVEIETSSLDDRLVMPVEGTAIPVSPLWVKENPTGAYIAVVGTGVTATNLVLAGTATSAGGASINLGNLGARKLRVKVVVAGVGGVFRVAAAGKA